MSVYQEISHNKIRTYTIIVTFIVLITGFFYLLGQFTNSANAFLAGGLIFSIFSTVGSYFYSDKIVLYTVGAVPATKEKYFNLYTVTENLCISTGVPMPKLYVIPDSSPNAFATGRDPKHAVVCATTGILELLDRAELEGVIAHELSHVKNYDILLSSIVAVLVGTVALVSNWMMRGFWWGGDREDREGRNPIMLIIFIVMLILTPIVATLIQLAVSRRREFLADASGALITRHPEGLASALEKIAHISKPLSTATTSTAHLFISDPFKSTKKTNWMLALFNTHPPTEERIRILRSM